MTRLPAFRPIGPLAEHVVDVLVSDLASTGLAMVEGVDDERTLLWLAGSLAVVAPHRDGAPNGITLLADRGRVAGHGGLAGFGAGALAAHTDRSSLPEPPGLLIVVCRASGRTGGESILADGQAVYADLARHSPGTLAALSVPRSVLFGGTAGHLGSVITHRPDGRVSLRLRWDSLARFSPGVSRVLPDLRAAVDRHTVEIALRPGQGYVIDNHRWLHGRRAFTGSRAVYRVLGDPHVECTATTGFMPVAGNDAFSF
jgi:alpha-ketoglutarate-dependent taurine dioxygenase